PEPYWFATAGGTGVPPLAFWTGPRSPRLIEAGTPVVAMTDGGRWFAVATADRRISIYLPTGTAPVRRFELSGRATALDAHGRWQAVASGTAVDLYDSYDALT